MKQRRILLTIAGFDPLCSAGICADVKVFAERGFKPFAAITCLTAQDAGGVKAVKPTDAGLLRDQLARLFAVAPVAGVKIGLVPDEPTAEIIKETLKGFGGEVVCDPVLGASGGQPLVASDFNRWMPANLFSVSTVITPNESEAERLFGDAAFREIFEMPQIANGRLSAVLIKGIKFEDARRGEKIISRYGIEVDLPHDYKRPKELHGTGCHYSSALLCALVEGKRLEEAAVEAREYLFNKAFADAYELAGEPMDLL